jgi:hypothetical protein
MKTALGGRRMVDWLAANNCRASAESIQATG